MDDELFGERHEAEERESYENWLHSEQEKRKRENQLKDK